MCVLAAVLDAVGLGHWVVVASDALRSVSDRAHASLLTLYPERFGQQIEVSRADTILAHWR